MLGRGWPLSTAWSPPGPELPALGGGKRLGSCLALVSPASHGQTSLLGRGRPALGLPLLCPAPARQLAQTQVSLPGGSQRLESPVVRARLGLVRPKLAGGLMSSWGKAGRGGRADRPPSLGSSPSEGWCPYRPILHSFIHSIIGSLLLSSYCPNLRRQPPPNTPQPHPLPGSQHAGEKYDLITSLLPLKVFRDFLLLPG